MDGRPGFPRRSSAALGLAAGLAAGLIGAGGIHDPAAQGVPGCAALTGLIVGFVLGEIVLRRPLLAWIAGTMYGLGLTVLLVGFVSRDAAFRVIVLGIGSLLYLPHALVAAAAWVVGVRLLAHQFRDQVPIATFAPAAADRVVVRLTQALIACVVVAVGLFLVAIVVLINSGPNGN